MTVRRVRIVDGGSRVVSRAATPRRRNADDGKSIRATSNGSSASGFNPGAIGKLPVTPTVDNNRPSGVGLLHQAMAVAAAADAYSARGRANISALTLQFLLGRSLELALNAYLIYRECAEESLRVFGRDLSQLLEQATAHSFEFHGGTSDSDLRAVAALSANYMRRMHDYPRVARYQLVAFREQREIVHRAIAAVFIAIWNKDPLRFNLRRASDRALGLCIADDACYDE